MKDDKNNPLPSRTGFVAEADHCATFNMRKALDRSNIRAVRESNGNHGDYRVMNGDKTILKGEVKYYNSAEKTENAMRGYDDMQLVGPSDQIKEIKKISRIKEIKGKTSAKPSRQKIGIEHEAVGKNAGKSISDGKTSSKPRSRKEMKQISKKAVKGKISGKDIMPPSNEALKSAAASGLKSGVKMGAVVGGAVGTAAASLVAIAASGLAVGLSGAGVLGALAAIGPGGVTGGLGTLAAAPGVIAGFGVNGLFEDDTSHYKD